MKSISVLLAFVALTLNSHAGPFVAGGNGVMSLAYCSTDNGDFGATVNKDIKNKLTGYAWVDQKSTTKISKVKYTKAAMPGTPAEKPMTLKGGDFSIEVMMSNLPTQPGAPIQRTGAVIVRKDGKVFKRTLSCTLFGLETL